MADFDEFDDTIETADAAREFPSTRPRRSRRTDHELRSAYRGLRAQKLRQWAAAGVECYFGDGPIDYSLGHGDERAATVHHTIPVAVRPDLELETSLWAPAHSLCNRVGQAACTEERRLPPGWENDGFGIPSEVWEPDTA